MCHLKNAKFSGDPMQVRFCTNGIFFETSDAGATPPNPWPSGGAGDPLLLPAPHLTTAFAGCCCDPVAQKFLTFTCMRNNGKPIYGPQIHRTSVSLVPLGR